MAIYTREDIIKILFLEETEISYYPILNREDNVFSEEEFNMIKQDIKTTRILISCDLDSYLD